jgi:site-specific recombinase XerD
MGLSQATIRRKVQVLTGLAQFLARYYTKALPEVTYAMYDEYLFFHYPRHHTNRVARSVRTMISTLREFYQQLAQQGDPRALTAANAMYACRAQAEQVLALLIRIQQYPHELTTLVVHLFAPYTA